MPTKLARHAYPATTYLVASLAVLFGLGAVARRFLPESASNSLIADGEDYLESGRNEDIDWRPFAPEAFAEARRLDRLILLVVGSEADWFARSADRDAFRDPEVVASLRQHFVCVRVDVNQFPHLGSAYLPLQRVELGINSGFGIWILDPAGRLAGSISVRYPMLWVDNGFVMPGLRQALARRGTTQPELQPGREQNADLARLYVDSNGVEPYAALHAEWLAKNADPLHGGWPLTGIQTLRPWSYRFLFSTGYADLGAANLEPVLESPIVDWLDGGFFYMSQSQDWASVEYDKYAVHNADMMSALAVAQAETANPVYAALAENAFDALATGFAQDGVVRSYRIGDELRDRRSARSSFPVRDLRASLSPAERDWVRKWLGLRVETNPRMVIRTSDAAGALKHRRTLEAMLSRLRAIKRQAPARFGGELQLDSAASAVARMLETARLLGDKKRLDAANRFFGYLAGFRVGTDEVVHSLRSSGQQYRYLGDYLAYSDAALQHYLATGVMASFRDGLVVLERALDLFQGRAPGSLHEGLLGEPEPALPGLPGDRLADDWSEGSIARAIRLCQSYSCLCRSTIADAEFGARGQRLRQEALATMKRYSGAAIQVQRRMSGFFLASQQTLDDVAAFVVGPEAVEKANRLQQMAPHRLVAPALFGLRPGLQAKKPGIYIFEAGRLVQDVPYAEDEAAVRLGVAPADISTSLP